MKNNKTIIFLFLAVFGCLISPTASACDPNEDCVKCQVTNPFNGGCTLSAEAPDCVVRRDSCKGCISLKALKYGASFQCVTCVVGAIASGGTVAPACALICGGAAVAEKVAADGGC